MTTRKPAPGNVLITLPHGLGAHYARLHGLEDRQYGVGEPVEVNAATALALVRAGHAQNVDPQDPAQVQAATTPDRPATAAAADKPASETAKK